MKALATLLLTIGTLTPSICAADCLLIVASRESVAEARDLAIDYTRMFDSVEIFEIKNGRFAISLGSLPLAAGSGIGNIVDDYNLPPDAFCMDEELVVNTVQINPSAVETQRSSSADIVNPGIYSSIIGLYWPNEEGDCLEGDLSIDQVCIPSATYQNYDYSAIVVGLIEATNPELLPDLLDRHIEYPQAFEVKVESYRSGVFNLIDGSTLENKDGSYVGYIGFNEDAVFFGNGFDWSLCVSGSVYKVNVVLNEKYHYSRKTLSITRDELMQRDECAN